jgi:hypothetical protein
MKNYQMTINEEQDLDELSPLTYLDVKRSQFEMEIISSSKRFWMQVANIDTFLKVIHPDWLFSKTWPSG